jgi:putative endonuclease
MITNSSNTVLYIGVTNNIERRLFEHKSRMIKGFSSKYNLTKLVYYEEYSDIKTAVEREKYLKGWKRSRKNDLIATMNPNWTDLSLEWYGDPSRCSG